MAADLVHGTRSTYVKHECRCEPCKRANREFFREYRLRQAGIASVSDAIHGTLQTYRFFDCRCERCKCAGRVYRARRCAMFWAGNLPEVEHGRNSTYNTYGCRCDECKEAARVYRLYLKMRQRVKNKLAS